MVNNSTNINKQIIISIQWWSTIPSTSSKQTITSIQWWLTIPPISTKQIITSIQWWSTIPSTSSKQTITSMQWRSTIPPISTKEDGDFCESYCPFHVCLTICLFAHLVYATSHLSFIAFYSYLVSWLVMIWACAYYTDFTDGWFLWEL